MVHRGYLRRVLICLLSGLLLVYCSKEKNPAGPATSDRFVWVHFNGDSTKHEFEDMKIIDVTTLTKRSGNENNAIWLYSFIGTDLIPMYYDKDDNPFDTRNLYAYRMVGDDGFSASVKGYRDNIWDEMDKGYIMTETRNVVFPDDILDLPGAYNVKETRHIKVNRKVDVTSPDTTGMVRLKDLTVVRVLNDNVLLEDAVSLKDVVEAVISNPENYHYTLTALDGYTTPDAMTWEQFQTGYWLLDSEKTWFTDPNFQSGKYKVKVLEGIVTQ